VIGLWTLLLQLGLFAESGQMYLPGIDARVQALADYWRTTITLQSQAEELLGIPKQNILPKFSLKECQRGLTGSEQPDFFHFIRNLQVNLIPQQK